MSDLNFPQWFLDKDPNYRNNFDDVDNIFEKLDDDYDNEREVQRMLMMEAYNRFGTPMLYYIVSYNEEHNPIFGEDMDRRVERAFPFMGMPEGLPEERQDMGFQIEGLDNFVIYISKDHFHHMSSKNIPSVSDESGLKFNNFSLNHITEDKGTGSITWTEEFQNSAFSSEFNIGKPFQSYIPKVGDILKLDFNDYLYEVKTVKEEDSIFHQHKHAWTVRVGKFVNQHLNIDDNDFNEETIKPIVNTTSDDMDLALNDIVDVLKEGGDTEAGKDVYPTEGSGKNTILYDPTNEKDPRFKDEGW